MTDQTHRDDLAQLRAELAAQRAVTGAQQARLARLERRRRFPRRFLPVALVGLLVALLPLSLFAAGFTDLNGGPDHAAANADINAIAAVGITKGCNPPDYTNYCPNDYVTREQMASFLARTAGLGTNVPVVNARTVGGRLPNNLVRAARGTGGFTTLNAGFQPIATVIITPADTGFVLLNATATFHSSGLQNTAQFQLRDTKNDSVSPLGQVATSSTLQSASGAMTYAFGVSGTTERTFVLEASNQQGTTTVFNAVITALYVPYGYEGGPILSPVNP